MTTTARRPAALPAESVPSAPRRRGQARLLALAGALTVLGAVAGVTVFNAADEREPVIAVAQTVPFGQQVTDADLLPVGLPRDSGLAVIAWSRVAEIVGRTATTDLLPGQVMTLGAVSDQRLPAAGQAVVGMAVKRGQAPATPLSARDRVLVVDAGATAGGGVEATVLRSTDADTTGLRTIDLLVSAPDAPRLARLSESGRAVLVLVVAR